MRDNILTIDGKIKMFSGFMPDGIFDDIYAITPEFLLSLGVRGLILDIDNTLVTYDDPVPTEKVAGWLEAMHDAGISTAFVSNNHRERVEEFCRNLDCFCLSDAGKPSRKGLFAAMEHMGTDVLSTAAVGDQVFTDVWAAKRCGMRSFLVPPIKDKTTLFFRFKRLLERPVLHAYYRSHK